MERRRSAGGARGRNGRKREEKEASPESCRERAKRVERAGRQALEHVPQYATGGRRRGERRHWYPAFQVERSLLIVDDEQAIVEVLGRKFRQESITTEAASSAEVALEALQAREFALVLMDLTMPGMGGLEGLKRIKERHRDVEVVIMTGDATVDSAVMAMKQGAFEFLQKPFESLDHVVLVCKRALERGSLRAENARLLSEIQDRPEGGLLGVSRSIRAVAAMVPDLARSDASVLIEGESGTGKEVLARWIHTAGPRAAKPFVPVNCGAIPEAMLESELFGHEKGAFTGAVSATKGLFRAADGGTLFLDEIGEIPLGMQVKLLRVLQEQEVRAVGATITHKVNVRVLAATNRDLRERIAKNAFRDDLYYRLAVVPVKLAPLRERRDDIPVLVRHFFRLLNVETQRFTVIVPEALDRLVAWPWPGNVRELENVMERAFAIGRPGVLTLEHLPEEIIEGPVDSMATEAGAHVATSDLSALPLSLDAFERYAIEVALSRAGGDAEKAAEILGLPRSTFYRRLQRHGIKR